MKDFNVKKFSIYLVGAVLLVALVWAGVFWWNNLRGVGPAIKPPSENIAEIIKENNKEPGENETNFPLEIADNFEID
ncbi:MAG: hypothetical protein R3251_04695, partial [Candidatus Spechtbacterales bacterium]|nr:hypothetical protein [Candidatus Spechtbacterales bacterium]